MKCGKTAIDFFYAFIDPHDYGILDLDEREMFYAEMIAEYEQRLRFKNFIINIMEEEHYDE